MNRRQGGTVNAFGGRSIAALAGELLGRLFGARSGQIDAERAGRLRLARIGPEIADDLAAMLRGHRADNQVGVVAEELAVSRLLLVRLWIFLGQRLQHLRQLL